MSAPSEGRGLSEEDRERIKSLIQADTELLDSERESVARALALIDQYEAALARADDLADEPPATPRHKAVLGAYLAARATTQEGGDAG